MNKEFISQNETIKKIINSLYTLAPLNILAIVIGPPHTGKKTLIKSIFPHYPFFDANNKKALKEALKKHDKLVIYNFEAITSFDEFDFLNKQIIAIANNTIDSKIVNQFAFKFFMPSLEQRKEDIPLLVDFFYKKAQKDLDIHQDIKINPQHLDISNNNHSLKASIYKELFFNTLEKEDIKTILEQFFLKHLEEGNGYYENLDIYDESIIKAGLQKFKSQLKLSKVLGINRNTLRKKIEEYKID
jgi:DNA-binding protein Fis